MTLFTTFGVRFMKKFKVMLVGKEKSGKSSLFSRFIEQSFNENYKKTVDAEYGCKIISSNNNQEVSLEIWDLGYDQLECLPGWYDDTDVFLLTFDLTDSSSLDYIDGWLQQYYVHSFGKESKFILVGTKNDLNQTNDNEVKLKKLFHTYNIHLFMMTSAKNNELVQETFAQTAEMLINKSANRINKKIDNGVTQTTFKQKDYLTLIQNLILQFNEIVKNKKTHFSFFTRNHDFTAADLKNITTLKNNFITLLSKLSEKQRQDPDILKVVNSNDNFIDFHVTRNRLFALGNTQTRLLVNKLVSSNNEKLLIKTIGRQL